MGKNVPRYFLTITSQAQAEMVIQPGPAETAKTSIEMEVRQRTRPAHSSASARAYGRLGGG